MDSLELFSGAGGLAKGLELAGFNHMAFVEFNRHACKTLSANFEEGKVFFGDVRDFNLSKVGKVDIVAGGPPCQPFSLGGKHKAHADNRDMFPYAIKAIEELKPKAFIFENVKGLLRPSFADYFEYIRLRLAFPDLTLTGYSSWQAHLALLKDMRNTSCAELKYNVHYKLINTANYGVPQRRERVVIVGIRSDIPLAWEFPKETHSEERLQWEKYVTGEYWERHKVSKAERSKLKRMTKEEGVAFESKFGMFAPDLLPWKTVRDTLSDLPDPRTDHGIADHIFKDGAQIYPGHDGSILDLPAKTIKAGAHGVPGGENMIRFSDDSVRYFTVLEAKRIQTFPDNFIIKGAWGEAMRQIGNAVPVLMAEKLGTALFQLIRTNSRITSRDYTHKPIKFEKFGSFATQKIR